MISFLAPPPARLSFSGHDSFQCRGLWLKKGFDFLEAGNSFTSEDAVMKLGVGKNMVNAIRYWMRAFGLTKDGDQTTDLAKKLLADETGWDPYLEDKASLWLLHYELIRYQRASTYHLIFNGLRRDKIEFTKTHFFTYATRQAAKQDESTNENTVKSDFDVFVKMYQRTSAQQKDRDESASGLLTDLNLIQQLPRQHKKEDEYAYVIANDDRPDLPDAVLLYGILKGMDSFSMSVNFNTLLSEPFQVGTVFALNSSGLYAKLERIAQNRDNHAVFSDQAGVRELSFTKRPDPLTVLATYYAR